jgi:hypothetical protein
MRQKQQEEKKSKKEKRMKKLQGRKTTTVRPVQHKILIDFRRNDQLVPNGKTVRHLACNQAQNKASSWSGLLLVVLGGGGEVKGKEGKQKRKMRKKKK